MKSLSRVWLFVTPWIAARQASLSITNSWSLLKLTSIESVMPSSHLILCLLLPPIPPSIRVFSNESTLRMRWPKYWSININTHTLTYKYTYKITLLENAAKSWMGPGREPPMHAHLFFLPTSSVIYNSLPIDNKQKCVSSCREMNELCDAENLWIEVSNTWI